MEETIIGMGLQPGDKIPSIRKVSVDLSVSPCTVNQAYAVLEARGLITSHPRSGYYISDLNPVKEKTPIQRLISSKFGMHGTEMNTAGKTHHVNFSTLGPINELIPIPKISKMLQASMKDMFADNFQYPFPEGLPRLRKQIAIHSLSWRKSLIPDDVLITNGCMEAINLCLEAVTKPGDTVAIESPACPGILQSLKNKGLHALEIPMDTMEGLDLNALEEALANNAVAACLFMPVCHHPTGSSMSVENKLRLLQLLGNKNIPLIEDDALGELHFSKDRPLPAKAYDTYDNVLYCSSFSKSLAPGFRIGWIAAGKFQEQVKGLKFSTNVSTNSVLQDAIARYMENGNYLLHVRKLRQTVRLQLEKYRSTIVASFPAQTGISIPVGGYSLWIELPQNIDSLMVQQKAAEIGIDICAGPIFSPSASYSNFICINCCPLFNNRISTAIVTLGCIIGSMLPGPSSY